MGEATISARLRQVKEQNEWTAQKMADMTGISRRTLESYMRRKDAALPGPEALRQISEGLGVSLDWLILGDDRALLAAVLTARLTAEHAALPVLKEVIEAKAQGMVAETLASEIGAKAAEHAETLFASGVTLSQVAGLWRMSQEQLDKAVQDRIADLKVQLAELQAETTESAG